jgi:hypothetical protein
VYSRPLTVTVPGEVLLEQKSKVFGVIDNDVIDSGLDYARFRRATLLCFRQNNAVLLLLRNPGVLGHEISIRKSSIVSWKLMF